jgi:putative flavoprotein involved in K+ transport
LFDTTIDELPDPASGPRAPSLQLVGRDTPQNIDLNTLQQHGVQIVGRLDGIAGTRARFRRDLRETVRASERRLHRTLDLFDASATRDGLTSEIDPPDRPEPIHVPPTADAIDLHDRGIATVLWATGFARSYPWLHIPVLNGAGDIVQRRGVTASPGLYVLGLRFQHHRNSNFIDGVGRDAGYIARHIVTDGARRQEAAA